MEGEARDQKLRAGKEKLAQFQRKKRKKKPRPEEAGSSAVTVGESANILPPLPAEFETDLTIDSDSLTTTSGSEDDTDSAQEWSSRAQLQLKSKLQEKSRRVEELEESLVGKQLALDKVIQENEKLKTLISHVQNTEVSDANHNALGSNQESQNQSSPVNGMTNNQSTEAGSSANTEVNEAGSQEFSMSDVQELLHHVQWLQLQLKQANTTLQIQNEKQKESIGALQNAKKEIAILQDSITHKDKLLNELIDKMKQISTEYESFKQYYAKSGENKNEKLVEELEKHCHTVEEMNTALKKELQKVVTEKEKEIQELIDNQGVKIGQLTEEYEMKIKELESNLQELRIKHEGQELNYEKIQNENVGLQSYCDTLTKGLEFLKEEHEKVVTELNELSAGFKVLKSEYDILVDEKGQFVAKSESLEAALNDSQIEKEHISTEMSVLKKQYKYLEKELNDTKEQLEIVRVEHQRYFNDNNTLVDQLAKQKEDNMMYQNQIAEYEGKLCESAEILEENRSLHWQNDELNNRINNQKDVIASLKNELEVLGMEKSQFADHMKNISADLEEIKKENDILKADKEQLLNEVRVLKENMHQVEEENLKYKVSHVALNEEIQSLKQSLSETHSKMQGKVPLLSSGRYTKFELTTTDMNDMNREKLDEMNPSEEVEDFITPQEDVYYTEEMPLVHEHQTHEVSLNSDLGETVEIVKDSVKLCESLSEPVMDKTEMTDSAKTKNVSQTVFQDKNRKIEELEGEIEKLNNVIVQLQSSALSAGVSASVHKAVQNDDADEEEVDSISNKVSTQTSTNDTAYESLYFEHQDELGGTGVNVLAERLAETQQKLDTVSQMLSDRNKEYEEVKLALMQAQDQLAQDSVAVETTSEDSTSESALQLNHYTQPKVSENSSVTSLGMEVNMHASSSFCFVPNHGVVSLDSSPVTNVKGSSEFYVDKGSFQNLAEGPVDEKEFSDTKLNDMQVPHQKLHIADCKCVDSFLTEQTGSTENSGVLKSETFELKNTSREILIESMNLQASAGTVTMLDEKSLNCELELTKESLRKMEIERRKLESLNSDLQIKLKEFNDTEHERKEKAEELCHEHEKLTWERDQLIESLHNIEKEMFAIKTAKCDVEFQKVQYEEELNRVKERLEYLESSDNDIIEIKDMLEKVQEERENIFGENEKLQCSLSAHIEENEKLLENIEYLQKENSSYLERLEVKELEIISVTTEYKDCKTKIEKLEKNLNEIISEKLSQESRFEGEIEGLLEENSTLKTCVHMKESEIETLMHENDRLNSFFPNTDEQIENSKLLKARNGDLEKEMKDLALENQSLVSELMESQEKLSGAAVENEELLDKCDEFQRVICELDDEKATLVESYERAKQETKAQLKENENMIEKYENQLECLDQENSTLKTHLMSLHQELEDNDNSNYGQVNIEKDNLKIEKEMLQIENERYKVKVQELEEDLLGLVEQVKLYDESVKEKEGISVRLEARINEILQENTQLKEKCASVEESLHEQKENEIYLKEQIKIYESALNSEEETKELEVQRLEGQLELEKKYKNKFENSLAQAQSQISGLESENTSLKGMNVMLQRDLELEIQKTAELEQEFSTTKSELDNAVIERERIVKEKMEFSEKLNASTKVNEELISEVSVLQNHLQAVADNRNHIRNQIEILAAEIENLQKANESLGLHNREIGLKFKMVVSSNDKLAEENKLFTAEIMEISDKSQKLADENELLRQRNKKLEDNIQENLDSVKEEMNNLHYENEKLTEENVRLKENMIADESNFSETAELQAENDRLKSENEELEDQNEKLRTRFRSLGEKLASLDELIERNIAAELDNDSLGDRLDVLHKRISEIQKEKESLQIMTNELTNMLHDMQTKYEEVKSEMESTKKKCDKEIEHLQNQLHEMNDDVSELRKMLDYMENEMYSTTEEKNMLKENLEQQQSQFAEVIEEKQKLEEIISNKQQKDLKNMQMASQRQKHTAVPYSRSEQDIPCNEPNTVEASCSNSEFNEVAAPAVSERMRESIDSDLSDIVPSFQSAFHLFGLASSGETCVTSRMVQTNVTMSGSGNTSFMIDNNGENTDYNTDSSKIHSEAQTDISCQPYSHFNFQNSVFEPLFNENDENEITNVEDFADNTPGFGNGELSAQGVVDSHQTGRISEVTQYVEDNYCKSLGKCNISSETEIQVKSVYCQNDSTLSQNLENSELLTQDISSQTDLEENIIDLNSGNVSILSVDSGILSACVDGKIQPFHYTENETVIDREIHNEQDTFEAENFVEISSENSENISKEAEFFDIGIQTDKDFGDEIEKSLADDRERLEADHEEKIKELEAEIESRLVKVYEFREQKIKLLEDNYERKVKQVEYDLEEKYEQKFRMREVDIIMEADRDKKIHAAEVENAAEIKVEQIKREKDQQFVETLQKVKADLAEKHRRTSGDMRRAVSHDVRPRDRDQDIGADGDGKGTYGANTWQKLVAENQKHEGDDLQKSVVTNQQNTIAFCQQLLGIMGEHTTMGNNKPPKNQQAPTLLDWDLSPELSFGSVQSSLGTNTLERSLDTSTFCSNSECVNLRMKYEQLMGKIEQYLKLTTSQDHVKESDTKCVPDVVDGKSELDKDMFVEHNEDLSHMLYRGTSIDLEHCFRVPSSLNKNSLDDHFVEEVDDTKDTVEITSDIIDLLVKDSNDAAVKKYNWEGHFSENEEVDEENEGDEQKQIILDHGRGSISFVEDTRSFLKEESLQSRKKRHYSESDLRTNVKESESETFQSENKEGFFVLEGGVSKEEADQRSKSKTYISDDEASDQDGNSDGVFEEIQNSLDAPVFMENTGSPRLHLDHNKFIEESNEYKPPGLEEFAMCAKTEPLTGEEAGDFFEEKIVKSVVLSSGSVKNIGTVALSTPPRQDFADVEQNLESDLSSVKHEYKKGNQSYENTVFDILNAICPGTVPGRRPCDSVAKEDTFQPVIGEVESAVNDFGESQTENNLQKLKAELGNMKLELQSLTKENTDLKEMMIIKDLDSKKDIEVLQEKITALEKTNLEKNAEVLHAKQLLSSNMIVEEKCRNLENANMELLNDLEIYKNQMSCFESDLEGKAKENADKLEMLKMILESERNEQKNLKLQYTETEKLKNELELQCCSFSSQNEKLESDLKMLENSLKNNEKEMSVLKEEKGKLISENNSLKSVIESNEDVLQSQEKLKLKIQELLRQEDVLREELKKQTDVFQVEKDELEKALIAQADMYDSLEKTIKDQEIESNKLKECLEIQEKNKEALQENIEIVMNENKILKEDLDKEISTKMESKIKENELLSEISALKSEINELNVLSSQMSTENEKLKVTAKEAVEKTTVMKEEKEKLKSVIQEIGKEKKDMEEKLRDKETTISELIKAKQDLVHQIEKFEEDAKSLQSNVAEMKETVDKLTKENNMLESFQSDMQGVQEENESLKLELLQMKERNRENEWAFQELSKEVEKQELNTSNTNEKPQVDKSTETKDIIDGFKPKENKRGLVDAFSNTDDHLGFEIHEKELTLLKEEIICLKTKNSALENNLKEISSRDTSEQELEALKLENETLKRSLDFAIVKDDSDTDLQIFEDMKDAIRSMQAEKSSVDQYEKEMSDSMEQENKRLRDEIEDLYAETDQLKKSLKNQEESARKENREILKMYSDLRNEVEVLVISKHDLEVELNALKDLLEHDPYPTPEKSEHDTSKELTLEDLEEMEELKASIEKLKSDLKERDSYVRKLEEHLLSMDGNIPELTSTPKPSLSKGMPFISKSFLRRGQNLSSHFGRRAYSQDMPSINVEKEFDERNSVKPELERSQTLDSSLHICDLESYKPTEKQFHDGLKSEKLTSSVLSDSSNSSVQGSFGVSERIRSGLKAEEDGHLALELKQFELVAEITKLRRDFRETKALYSKETALLTEALEKEKLANELRGMSDLSQEHNVGSNLSHDVLKLRKEVATLREQNKLLNIDCDRWVERLTEQEQIVADLKERISQNTSGYEEIEEVFGRQLALLQKQREELIDKLKDRERENSSLSAYLGEKVILEETLRKEKDVLSAKLKEKEKIEEELLEKKLLLEEQASKQKELEDIVYQKDLNEIELMKQKRILEEELREIESRFRDREENLDFEKNKLLNELREKRTKAVRSRFSESEDEVSSVCSESAAFSERNIGRLEVMLEEVEKQHSLAVNVLREQLHVKYNRREKEFRSEHAAGLARLKQDSRNQVK